MRRRRRKVPPYELGWAGHVIDAVRSWDPQLVARCAPERGVVDIVGIGEVDLVADHERVTSYVADEQRNEMCRRAHRVLEPHLVVPADWMTGDRDLDRDIVDGVQLWIERYA